MSILATWDPPWSLPLPWKFVDSDLSMAVLCFGALILLEGSRVSPPPPPAGVQLAVPRLTGPFGFALGASDSRSLALLSVSSPASSIPGSPEMFVRLSSDSPMGMPPGSGVPAGETVAPANEPQDTQSGDSKQTAPPSPVRKAGIVKSAVPNAAWAWVVAKRIVS